MDTQTANPKPSRMYGGWPTALLWSGPALLVVGIAVHRLWEHWPAGRTGELLLLALASWAGAKLATRFICCSVATGLVMIWTTALVLFAGPLQVLAMSALLLAGFALGNLLLKQSFHPVAQCIFGTVSITCAIGWLLPLPIHHRWLYVLAILLLIMLRWHQIATTLRGMQAAWSTAVTAAPKHSAFAVTVLGLASTADWLPTLQFDDLVYHLRLPWQLLIEGYYPLDPGSQVWALAPWFSDIVHAIPQLLAGHEARGAVNAAWLLIMACGVWQLASNLGGDVRARWLSIALVASLPLVAALSAGMQTELASSALLVWLMAVVAGPKAEDFRWWIVITVLCGGLAATKLTAAAMAGVVLLWALLRHPWPSPARIVTLPAIGLALAGSNYVYAAAVGGNPFLPLFNAWFRSPYFAPVNFSDARWESGFGPLLPWNMTFDTGRFLESYPGGGGFIMIALAGVWLLALFDRQTRSAACVATTILLAPLLPIQYLRYAFPGLVLLCPILVVAAFRLSPRQKTTWLIVLTAVLNLGFQANSHWMLRTGMVKLSVKHLGFDEPIFEKYAPERVLLNRIRAQGTERGNILLMDEAAPFFAEAGSRGRAIAWYDPDLLEQARRADADPSGGAWQALLQRERIGEVIVKPGSAAQARMHGLTASGGRRQAQVSDAEWWHLPPPPAEP